MSQENKDKAEARTQQTQSFVQQIRAARRKYTPEEKIRKEVQVLTISRRKDYNYGLRELANAT
ncbi:MAG: hypothetical protein PHN78_09395 [Dehalococcoidales bacterium]|nr:hypothetical protein [Dehalococcoidales bacterium]